MSRKPRILTLWLDTWYGRGGDVPSSEVTQFGNGLFESLGYEEIHVPLEMWRDDPKQADKIIKWSYPYDWAFVVPFDEILYPLKELVREAPVVAWMSDCVWRYSNFGRYWQGACDLIVTTDADAASKYGAKGLLSNWACRPDLWPKIVREGGHWPERRPLASFHGQMYGSRLHKILDLDRGPVPLVWHDAASNLVTPYGYFYEIAKSSFALCLTSASNGARTQMKARMFEPQLFGTILVTEPVPLLGEWWEPDDECIVFESPQEAQEKMQRLLDSPSKLLAMSDRAASRALSEHTYQHRIRSIMDRLGVAKP